MKAKDTRLEKQLNAIQRPFLLAITKAYRTTANAAIQVLSGEAPLSIEASVIATTYNTFKDVYNKIKTEDLSRPRWGREIPKLQKKDNRQEIFVDALRDEDNATGLCKAEKKEGIWRIKRKADNSMTSNDAEAKAIEWGIDNIEHNKGHFVLWTDSESTIEALRNREIKRKSIIKIRHKLYRERERNKVKAKKECRTN